LRPLARLRQVFDDFMNIAPFTAHFTPCALKRCGAMPIS